MIILWNRVIVEKLTVAYIVKFPAFCDIRKFVALLARKEGTGLCSEPDLFILHPF